jgi:hypothetical protein
MARLDALGADNAWARLQQVVRWFDEVQAAGGYRAYYKDKPGITLQGGGTAGGLGLDHEFFESVLVPQVVLDGFLGFHATGDGFRVNPRLPKAWPALTVDHIGWHGLTLAVTAQPDTVVIRKHGETDEPVWITPPPGTWAVNVDGKDAPSVRPRAADGAVRVDWQGASSVTLRRLK